MRVDSPLNAQQVHRLDQNVAMLNEWLDMMVGTATDGYSEARVLYATMLEWASDVSEMSDFTDKQILAAMLAVAVTRLAKAGADSAGRCEHGFPIGMHCPGTT